MEGRTVYLHQKIVGQANKHAGKHQMWPTIAALWQVYNKTRAEITAALENSG